MSSDELMTQYNAPHGVEFEIDQEATVVLGRCLALVGALPQLVGAQQHEAVVRELVTWYERVLADDEYRAEPPTQGLDALVDELVHVSIPPSDYAELAKGRSAIRVAEELVSWRRSLRDHDADSVPIQCVTDRLEQAVIEARNHLAGDWTADQ